MVADDLSRVIDEHYAAAAAAWPAFTVSRERFVAFVSARAGQLPLDIARTLAFPDLYLAAACTDGDAAALAAFRDTIVPSLRPALGKLALAPSVIDETIQRVLVIVFVGEGQGAPQLATYGGRGTLRSWLRTIAVRTGRRASGEDAHSTDDELADLPAAVADPELELLRSQYRDQVRGAFAAAFAELPERDRNVLRQYHIDGLTIDQLAALYQVNRATTARWVAGARLAVLKATRGQLVTRFGIDTTEVDSIIRLVRSQLDVSVREISR